MVRWRRFGSLAPWLMEALKTSSGSMALNRYVVRKAGRVQRHVMGVARSNKVTVEKGARAGRGHRAWKLVGAACQRAGRGSSRGQEHQRP